MQPSEAKQGKRFFSGIKRVVSAASGLNVEPVAPPVVASPVPAEQMGKPPTEQVAEPASIPSGPSVETPNTPAPVASVESPQIQQPPVTDVTPQNPLTKQIPGIHMDDIPDVTVVPHEAPHPEVPAQEQAPTVVSLESQQPSNTQAPAVSQEPTIVPVKEEQQVNPTPVVDVNKPVEQEDQTEAPVVEDKVVTELIGQNPERFVHDGVVDFAEVRKAKQEYLIENNPQANALVKQLNSIGVVDPEVIDKVLEPLLKKAA